MPKHPLEEKEVAKVPPKASEYGSFIHKFMVYWCCASKVRVSEIPDFHTNALKGVKGLRRTRESEHACAFGAHLPSPVPPPVPVYIIVSVSGLSLVYCAAPPELCSASRAVTFYRYLRFITKAPGRCKKWK